jgi:ABC-type sugar transport system ATPase subunit
MLSVGGLSKSFAGTRALRSVSLDVHPSEIHALIGENGAGKTTFLMIVSGVFPPDRGHVVVDGRKMRFTTPRDAQAAGIGTVFQELSLAPALTVAENIFAGRAPARWGLIDRRQMHRRARDLLRMLGSDIPPDAPLSHLGRGALQAVEIAKALSLDARVFLMDEPTASLSRDETEAVFRVLRRLTERGIGVVFVSHRLGEVFEVADRITVLRDGRLVGTFKRDEITTEQAVRSMVGRELSALYPERTPPSEKVRLELLGVRSGPVGPVNLHIRGGEIVGLAGLRGAGRSRLARAVVGAAPLGGGVVRIDGEPIRSRSPAEALRYGVAYVPADRARDGLFPRMTLAENLTAVALRSVAPGGVLRGRMVTALAERLRSELGVRAAALDQPVRELSGGNQQKVMLAKWLASRPRVLIVDEPTQGIDVGAKAEVHRLLRDLATEGLAVLLISSDLPEILGMSDRIAVMAGGRLRGVLEGSTATEEEVLSLAAETEEGAA